eukprot:15146208-Alexandrium_andersonii.AAC.1
MTALLAAMAWVSEQVLARSDAPLLRSVTFHTDSMLAQHVAQGVACVATHAQLQCRLLAALAALRLRVEISLSQ